MPAKRNKTSTRTPIQLTAAVFERLAKRFEGRDMTKSEMVDELLTIAEAVNARIVGTVVTGDDNEPVVVTK